MEIQITPENVDSKKWYEIVANIGGKSVGFGSAIISLTELEIKNILVNKDARGQGVGGKILKDLEKWGIEHGAETAWSQLVPLHSSMQELENLFAKHGYHITDGFAEKTLKNSEVVMGS